MLAVGTWLWYLLCRQTPFNIRFQKESNKSLIKDYSILLRNVNQIAWWEFFQGIGSVPSSLKANGLDLSASEGEEVHHKDLCHSLTLLSQLTCT